MDAGWVVIAQHSAKSVEHYTPAEYVEAARSVMGGIDLDPASCAKANETVKAYLFFDKGYDGLRDDLAWSFKMARTGELVRPRVFLNPPGGKVKNKSEAALWWAKLARELEAGRVTQFVFVGFTLEILRTAQDYSKYGPVSPLSVRFVRCFPRERICFGGKKSPTHANVIVYGGHNRAEFIETFSKFGECL